MIHRPIAVDFLNSSPENILCSYLGLFCSSYDLSRNILDIFVVAITSHVTFSCDIVPCLL